jgi:L-arabinose transport system ATP-binding protein
VTTSGEPAGAGGGSPLLELIGISKAFPNVQALDDVTLDLRGGEVLALVGENGAGKSTLLRILEGDYHPDQGELRLRGEKRSFASPREARALGVRVVSQEPEIVPDVSVAENIFAGELPRRLGRFFDRRALFRQTRVLLERFGFATDLDPGASGRSLNAAQRQLVEILRALRPGVSVIAFDEPTSSLTAEEADRLFGIVRRLADDGVAVVYVSHRMREVLHLADRIAILRDGKLIAVRDAGATSEPDLVRLMVGREISAFFERHHAEDHVADEAILRVQGISDELLRDVSLELYRGEVVGLAGLVGAGRTELAKALFGERRIERGRILVDGKEVRIRSPRDAIRAGLAFAPEDRKAEALVLVRSVRENVSLAILDRIRRFRFIRGRQETAIVSGLVQSLRVKTPSIAQEVGKLSGGNQQKVVLARWLARHPRVLILDEPTRGIDVGAKAEVYTLVRRLASDGVAVLFISSELPEILGISDRILVMKAGRITGELPGEGTTEEEVLSLAMVEAP